jgi:hypothetical protein
MRLREPAAWVVLGAVVINLVLALLGVATFEGPLASMGWMWSERVADPISLFALAVLVSLCVLGERTPHARQLTLISLIVSVIAVLLGLTFALLGIGATAPILAVLAAIVPQTISIVGVGLLIKLLRMQAVPRRLPPGIGLVMSDSEPRNGEPEPVTHSSSAPPAADQRLQPTLHWDTAADAGWRTAVNAAAGAPATGWRTEPPTVRLSPLSVPTPANGSSPDGWLLGDPAVQVTVPLPKEESPGPLEDPGADQEQWNSQPLALDWSRSPQS